MKKHNAVPKPPVRDPLETAVFAYWSLCCNVVAKKQPLVAANRITQAHLGAKPEAEGTLGGWRCSQCAKPCKCKRIARPKEATNEKSTS
jgi:hypothetical protein